MSDSSTSDREQVDYVEIIETDRLARSHFKRPVGADRPKGRTVEVPTNLLAHLAAFAGRPNWVVGSPVLTETKRYLRTDTEQSEDGGSR